VRRLAESRLKPQEKIEHQKQKQATDSEAAKMAMKNQSLQI
jgi:hypothetical protein